jgi:hypothetical protein
VIDTNMLFPAIFFVVFALLLWTFAGMPWPGKHRHVHRVATAHARSTSRVKIFRRR